MGKTKNKIIKVCKKDKCLNLPAIIASGSDEYTFCCDNGWKKYIKRFNKWLNKIEKEINKYEKQ